MILAYTQVSKYRRKDGRKEGRKQGSKDGRKERRKENYTNTQVNRQRGPGGTPTLSAVTHAQASFPAGQGNDRLEDPLNNRVSTG